MKIFRNILKTQENIDINSIKEILDYYKIDYEIYNEESKFTADIYSVFIIRNTANNIIYEFKLFELCYYLLTLIEGSDDFLFMDGDCGYENMNFEKAAFSLMTLIGLVNKGDYKNLVDAIYNQFKQIK